METNYNKMHNQNGGEKKQQPISEKNDQVAEEITNKQPQKKATVENCVSLNIRKEPNKDSQVVCVVKQGTSLIIGEKVNGWFEVYDKYGLAIEGYSMDEFIREC